MSKLGWIGLVLALGGCWGDGLDLDFGPDLGLQDAWSSAGLESRYMVGSVFPVEITRPERPVDEYEVVSLDPAVLQIVRMGIDFEATALAIGTTSVELRDDDEVVRRYNVEVTEPDSIELVIEREDQFGADLMRARTTVETETVMLAGESLDIHVRYYDEGVRVYGGEVLSFATDMPAGSPEWSPQGNVVRIEPDSDGTFPITFQVGSLERALDVIVTTEVASLELLDPNEDTDEPTFLVDAEGRVRDQFVRSEARDGEGRLIQGTLPIAWTIETDMGVVTGEGTHLGIDSDGSEFPVTAQLGDLTATAVARGAEIYFAP